MNKNISKLRGLYKQAGIYADTARAALGTVVPGAGLIGSLYGLHASDDDFPAGTGAINYIPGVGTANVIKQRRQQAKRNGSPDPESKVQSEAYGPISSSLIGGALGGIVGGVSTGGKEKGVALGAIAGSAAPAMLAMLLALARRGRTQKEQEDYDKGGNWKNWVIPGAARYNYYKSVGRLHREQGEKEDAAYAAGKMPDTGSLTATEMMQRIKHYK